METISCDFCGETIGTMEEYESGDIILIELSVSNKKKGVYESFLSKDLCEDCLYLLSEKVKEITKEIESRKN